MPNIEKVKLPVVKKTKKKTTKSKRIKTDPVAYYNCLLTYANQGWKNEKGTKKKITACCKNCKLNAPSLSNQRGQEIAKLITSYQQVGESLKKLLQPIK